jgi:hypothetical protein
MKFEELQRNGGRLAIAPHNHSGAAWAEARQGRLVATV